MTTVGQLTIEMAANVARLQQDMAKARSTVDGAMANIKKSADIAIKALGALGGALTLAAFSGFVRGAINTADEMSKLSQKIGVTVRDVAGLQLAFRQSGIEANTLQTSIAMLARKAAEGNDAFQAMGVSTKNVDGTLKSTRQLLGEVADRFAGYEDGAAKTALAIELFGRAGADLIPLLNGGSAALDAFDEMANKLGLTLDTETAKQAEKFNDTLDLMGQGMQGIGRQIAAEMLPTFSGLADQFFTTMTEGDRLKSIAEALSTGLKVLTAVAIGVVGAFQTVGTVLGGVGAVIVNVFRGDFQAAREIANQLKGDLSVGFKSTLESMSKAWNATGSAAFEAMALTNKQLREQAPLVKGATDAAEKKAGVDREALKQERERVRLLKEAERAQKDFLKPFEQSAKTAQDRLNQLKNEVDAMRLSEREQISLARAIEQTTIARLEEKKALIGNDVAAQLIEQEIEARRQIITMLESKELIEAANKMRENERSAWKKHHDQVSQFAIQAYRNIQSALADGLFQAFDDGLKGMVRSLTSAMGRIFSEVASLRILQGVGLGGSLGLTATNAAASTGAGGSLGSSAMNFIGSGFGMTNAIGSVGGMLPGSAGAFFSGMSGGAIPGVSSQAALMGSSFGAVAGPLMAAAVTTAIFKSFAGDKRLGGGFGDALNFVGDLPIIGDLVPVVPLVNALFGRGPLKQRDTVLSGTLGAGGFEDGSLRTNFRAKGGLFRSNKNDFVSIDALSGEISTDNSKLGAFAQELRKTARDVISIFNETASGVSASLFAIGDNLGLSTEGLESFNREIRLVSENGKFLTEEQITEEIAAISHELVNSLVPGIDQFAKHGETSVQVVQRINAEFDSLNGVLQIIGLNANESRNALLNLSIDQRTALVDMAGGAELLNQKAGFVFQNILTDADRLEIRSNQLSDALREFGVEGTISVQQLRNMMVSNTLSAQELNAAFNLAPLIFEVDNLRNSSNTAAAAVRDLSAVQGAFSALDKAVQAERNELTESYNRRLQDQNALIQQVNETIGKLTSLSNALKTATEQLRPLSLQGARGQLLSAIDQARSGNLPEAASLQQALRVLGSQSTDRFGSRAEFIRSQAESARLVDELGGLVDEQLSIEERNLSALEDARDRLTAGFENEIGRLDQILENARLQIDVLNGIDTTLLTIAEALTQFDQAVGSVTPATPNAPAVSDQEIRDYFQVARTPQQIAADAAKFGLSSQRIASAAGFTQAQVDQFFRDNPNIPRFATGTSFVPRTGPAIVHQGERIINPQQNQDLVDLLKQLVQKVEAGTIANNELYRLLRNAMSETDNGMAINTQPTS
ncbi:MAG: hypothetical protein LV471_11115 [Nitrosomonas sp.]|nr:hypothetical protein [Nitrosomonas sp.]